MPRELDDRPCTALAMRPCTALVRTRRWYRLRRIYRCDGCSLWTHQCVCGTGVLSLGHKLWDTRGRWRGRWFEALDILQRMTRDQRHLVLLDDVED